MNVFENPAYPVELGASIFVQVNEHLVNATRELGLRIQSAGHDRPRESEDSIGIWDGRGFIFRMQDSSSWWWNIAKLIWRYGWAPVRTQNLMKSTVGGFLRLYDEPMFPFKSLSRAAADAGLLDHTAVSGETFLEKNGVSRDFAREVIQTSTRVNYGQNLALIHGLESMVCMATEGAVSVEGGNWRIFDGMLRESGADVRLNASVTTIDRNPDGTITLTSSTLSGTESYDFDELIIAGPLQYSGLKINTPLTHTPDEIPYVKLHVALFSSPHRISPKFFGMDPGSPVPETILTTLPKQNDSTHSLEDGVGPAGFWSISTLQTVPDPSPSSGETHYVYKIFSPTRVSAEFISRLLGIPHLPNKSAPITDLPSEDVSWTYEKIWNPYPFLYPRVTFEETRLGDNVWYTSGIESFISTMETSALMGRNVAALVVGSWAGDAGGAGEGEGDGKYSRARTEL